MSTRYTATPIFAQLQDEVIQRIDADVKFWTTLADATERHDKTLAEAYYCNMDAWIQVGECIDMVGAECVYCGEYSDHEHPYAELESFSWQ